MQLGSIINTKKTYHSELQIKKKKSQTLGPASKRVLPDLLFFLEIF